MLTLLLFDWALIFLSSLSGATVIVESLDLTGGLATLVLVAALLAGVFIQSALLDREQAASPAPPNH
jgi:hypothetical protein